MNRRIDLVEQPTAVAAAAKVSPAETRRRSRGGPPRSGDARSPLSCPSAHLGAHGAHHRRGVTSFTPGLRGTCQGPDPGRRLALDRDGAGPAEAQVRDGRAAARDGDHHLAGVAHQLLPGHRDGCWSTHLSLTPGSISGPALFELPPQATRTPATSTAENHLMMSSSALAPGAGRVVCAPARYGRHGHGAVGLVSRPAVLCLLAMITPK